MSTIKLVNSTGQHVYELLDVYTEDNDIT